VSRAADDEILKLHSRLAPPRPWWVKWVALAAFLASVVVVPTIVWLLLKYRGVARPARGRWFPEPSGLPLGLPEPEAPVFPSAGGLA
jgi:hypothetical protein